ncbi:hypothetical protein VULLAG_LOCUS12325 [Vulpes lagopus]
MKEELLKCSSVIATPRGHPGVPRLGCWSPVSSPPAGGGAPTGDPEWRSDGLCVTCCLAHPMSKSVTTDMVLPPSPVCKPTRVGRQEVWEEPPRRADQRRWNYNLSHVLSPARGT